ncbi:cytochrome P450 [Catenuloplanes nepalensis]|uniref:Cytochrome P450 n=1 Tax=Catenuloplanes nepalensis TaxID=587533 RepID=A0ABT9MRG1_9ACTN|nr:hypothetical protein [Catenuloplanes nepalensis]MDP9793984.1 cytochrome P450 [Catenuloplanes nepalensis]
MVTTETAVLDSTFTSDIWATYRRVGRDGPVQPVTMTDGKEGRLVTGYDEAKTLLDDPRLSKRLTSARLEGEIALRKLLDRFSVLTPDPGAPAPRWRPSLLIHGLQNLPVTYAR